MSAAYLTALITFAAGILLLLGWAYLTTDNPRSNRLLVKSLWLFVLPGALIWALPESAFQFPLSVWVLIVVEELLKAFAARTEQNSFDKFWLVVLFGIWELMLAKAVWAVTGGEIQGSWGRLEIIGLIAAGIVPVLMHTATALIYAFYFKGRLWAALLVSWAIHMVSNESVDLFGAGPLVSGFKAFFLLILLLALWPLRTGTSTEESNA